MATTADFRNGLVIEYNGELHTIVQFQHVKPGKGPAFVRTKLKNMKTGRVLDNTFSSGTRVNVARVERRPYQYLYRDEIGYYFMHLESFEQIHVTEELIDGHEFLKEGENVEVVYHADTDTVLSVDIPHCGSNLYRTRPPGRYGNKHLQACNNRDRRYNYGAPLCKYRRQDQDRYFEPDLH